MARGARVEYPGALYHVIQRGNNREHIFERPEDCHRDGGIDMVFVVFHDL